MVFLKSKLKRHINDRTSTDVVFRKLLYHITE